jgi:hypothetical protein
MNNVYQRPLFMQQGGSTRPMLPSPPQGMMGRATPPMAPPMPRQAMAPPMPRPQAPPMAAPGPRPAGPMAPPGGGAPDMAGIASMISQKAKADISQAQGPEEIINAFRGNQRPLQARYQELAQYVGPQDATATPVSVLTMIQPSLMMTADGAAQSGIGELMAGITSDVAMEEAPGVPSRMGQGVGELMMAGQPPQPAGMAHGGIVKKFREGGSSLRDYYNEDLATYQEIMAPTDADRRTAKQSMLMDISSRALANAGGAGADKNIAGQIADIFQTTPSNYAAYQNQLRQGEGATRQAALESASGRVAADRASAVRRGEMDYESELAEQVAMQQYIYNMTEANAAAGIDATAAEVAAQVEIDAADVEVQADIAAAKLVADREGVDFEPMVAIDTETKQIIPGSPIFNGRALDGNSRMNAYQGGRQNITFATAPSYSDLNPVSTSSPDIKMLQPLDGGPSITYNLRIPSEAAAYRLALQNKASPVTIDPQSPGTADGSGALGSVNVRGFSNLVGDLANGETLDNGQQINLANLLTEELKPRTETVTDPTNPGQFITRTVYPKLNPFTLTTLQKAVESGRLDASVLQNVPGQVSTETNPAQVSTGANPGQTNAQVPVTANGVDPIIARQAVIKEQVDLNPSILAIAESSRDDLATTDFLDVLGPQEAFKNKLGTLASSVLGVLTGPEDTRIVNFTSGSDPEKAAVAAMNGLGVQIMTALQQSRDGRAAGDERLEFRALIPTPYSWTSTPKKTLAQYRELANQIARDAVADYKFLENTTNQVRQAGQIQEAEQSLKLTNEMYTTLEQVITGLENSINRANNPVSPSEIDEIYRTFTRQPSPTSP